MLQLIAWTATGLGVGWLARRAMRGPREFSLLGDLTTGWLGGLIGGWLFRRLGFVAPENTAADVLVAFVGATALLIGMRLLRHVSSAAGAGKPAEGSAQILDLEAHIRGLGLLERRIISGLLARKPTTRDPNQLFEAEATLGQRVADKVALFGGSWTFIGIFMAGMISWMALNQERARAFDPYPFILLNLVLSCLAALQAPVIMMSQNRQNARDRSDARNDYEVNVRAEMEIMALHAKLDAMRGEELMRLAQFVEQQQRDLEALRHRLDDSARDGGSGRPT